MSKGVTLVQGTVVVLKLDGSLVYIEAVETMYVAAVALPEQPSDRADERVFKPGCVGAKKISPFAEGEIVLVSDLSERNKNFIGTYEQLRTQHGPTYVDRTPEELAAHEAANAPKPDKSQKKAERESAKAAKKAAKGPRFLQRCVQCGEQSGHPNHPGQHEFVAPPEPVIEPEKCMACGKPEAGHGEEHKFIGESLMRKPKVAREAKPDKEAKAPRASNPGKPRKSLPDVNQKFKWVQNDAALKVLIAANGKFSPSNSGGAMIETIKASGDAGICVTQLIVKHPRPIERLQLALEQLRGSGLLEAV